MATRTFRFGLFEFDAETGELRRSGRPVKLAPQPGRVLATLLERAGHVVTRDDLKRHVWEDGTHVDFDQGLNFCIRQIRDVLDDAAESPRYVETIPRRGYRFIAAVERADDMPAARAAVSSIGITNTLRPKAAIAALLLLTGAAVAYGVWARTDPHVDRKTTIAVLPFEDLSSDRSQQYFSDGITEELTAQLGRVEPMRLRVIARSSMQAYRGAPRAVKDIGRVLGASHVVEGTVRRAGNRVRITAQLIRVSDESHVWAEVYEGELSDILSVQQEIGRAIARQVVSRINAAGTRRPSVDPEVYDLYLKGRMAWNRRMAEGVAQAIQSFEEALRRDPGFAPAYAGLGDCYMFGGRPETFARALDAANKALALDEQLAEAHVTKAHALMHQLRWAEAQEAFRRAIALDGSYPPARYLHGEFLAALGDRTGAMQEAREAVAIDPIGVISRHVAGVIRYYAGDYDGALPELRKALELDPRHLWTHMRIALVHERRGEFADAIREFEHAGRTIRSAYAYARGGRADVARRLIAELPPSPNQHLEAYYVAAAYVGLGDHDEALRWLEIALRQKVYDIAFLKVDPRLEPIRHRPEFAALLKTGGWQLP